MSEIAPKVFISYSHDNDQHKEWVLQLATRLRSNGVDVILDRWNLTLGSSLSLFMEKGLSSANRVIAICSDIYTKKANEGKGGAGYEKQIFTNDLISDQNTDYIIPLIKNNTERILPTSLNGRMYINFDDVALYEARYEELLRDLLGEIALPIPVIGKNPFENIIAFQAQKKFVPKSEKYLSPATSGTVSFDYSNNDGTYAIGQHELQFHIKFSKASKERIHIYNGTNTVLTVAAVKDVDEINKIEDARNYDTSSRVRTISLGQIAVFQNRSGFFAAIKIKDIDDDSRGDKNDQVIFDYVIQTNGTPIFKEEI
ncbi:toll/interleukin-1 receptor domain-containing protein [Chryseobacterium sp. AG363]|uniref:toll/interleukin-1 receptor domain-containing protein n=1 Tax=Chryseobacterium sp. AG363 TaxID=2183997 RepID=UPI000FF4EC84|nr:toll/interleukin-1 receptor domain-containing protein [Chryseobacterium sp. AG363]RKE80852.1 SEFIR domain-containing protein [Chryseobacterium sp. AG363]